MCQVAETRTGTQTVSSSGQQSGDLGAACGQQGLYGIAIDFSMESTGGRVGINRYSSPAITLDEWANSLALDKVVDWRVQRNVQRPGKNKRSKPIEKTNRSRVGDR